MGSRSKARWGILFGALRSASSGRDMWVSVRRHSSFGLLASSVVSDEDRGPIAVACDETDGVERICRLVAQKLSFAGPGGRVELHVADASLAERARRHLAANSHYFAQIRDGDGGRAPLLAVTDASGVGEGRPLPRERLRACYRLRRHALPSGLPPLHLWERTRSTVTVADLAGQTSDGVDNTGNVCMWATEEVLAWLVSRHAAAVAAHAPSVVELGAGMAGLAGLAAAAALGGGRSAPPPAVVLTDGNPAAAAALAANADECVQRAGPGSMAAVRCAQLKWDAARDPCAALGVGGARLVLAADCLFFEAFHDDLAATVRALIAPTSGVAWLLAPRRGGSLARFVERCAAHFRFVRVLDEYDDAVSGADRRFAAAGGGSGGYDRDIHLPALVVVAARAEDAAWCFELFPGLGAAESGP